MKVATFTVRADPRQNVRWKQAAEAEGFHSVGAWLAQAADAYLKNRATTEQPHALAWHIGYLYVRLEDGSEPKLRGWVSRPFGIFHGSAQGPIPNGSTHTYSLVDLAQRRLLATFRTARQCRALAAELAVHFARAEQAKASAAIERHERERV